MLTNQRSVLTMMTNQYRGQEAKGRVEEVGSEDADEDGGHGGHPAAGQQSKQTGADHEGGEGLADGEAEEGREDGRDGEAGEGERV